MKKIIGGRKYDTDTAEPVGSWDNGEAYGDLGYEGATLYRKRTGEHFLHEEGGANTRYAERDGLGGWTGGGLLRPLSYEQARAWAEANLPAGEYEAEFGEVPEDGDGTVAVTVRVSAGAAAALRRESSRTGESQSAIVERLLGGLRR